MAPDHQLLTKQVIGDDLNALGKTINVRFNLQRGKIARIWGFVWGVATPTSGDREYQVFVRKAAGAPRAITPQDLLWVSMQKGVLISTGAWSYVPDSIMFPKPHRTSGITVQMHANADSSARGLLIIYYDIDDVTKGELVQKWEKNITKGRTRRTIAP